MPAKKAQATKKATSKTIPDRNPCVCNTHLLHTINPDDPNADGHTPVFGPCGAETSNTFAPGHDAKLKGVLIRCFLAGEPFYVEEGGLLRDVDPLQMAVDRGWGHFLRSAHDRAESRRIAREDAKASRDAKKATEKATRDAAKAKAAADKAMKAAKATKATKAPRKATAKKVTGRVANPAKSPTRKEAAEKAAAAAKA